MSGTQRAKKTKKNRKWGRNKVFCDTYKRTNQEEKNRIKRLNKHLTRFPNDLVASKAKDNARIIVSGR
jgi:hypothetical protein